MSVDRVQKKKFKKSVRKKKKKKKEKKRIGVSELWGALGVSCSNLFLSLESVRLCPTSLFPYINTGRNRFLR